MKTHFKTDQEYFWAGDFGNKYTCRNSGGDAIASNVSFFAKIIARVDRPKSICELGANRGLNLLALRQLLPRTALSAVEINAAAVKILSKIPRVDVHHRSIIGFRTSRRWDMVFTKGVLIHVDPDRLDEVYETMYELAQRYILVAEYYNPTPISVPYRGYSDRLYKRDFCAEIRKRHPDLQLIDYGFSYHRDINAPQDDITWFLLGKRQASRPLKNG